MKLLTPIRGVVAPGPGENYHKGLAISNHKPKVAKKGYLEVMHLGKIKKKMPVFIIFNGSFAIFVWSVSPFSNHSLFKTAKNV